MNDLEKGRDFITVGIWTDGHGEWQARCQCCAWKSNWSYNRTRIVEQARAHRCGELARLEVAR